MSGVNGLPGTALLGNLSGVNGQPNGQFTLQTGSQKPAASGVVSQTPASPPAPYGTNSQIPPAPLIMSPVPVYEVPAKLMEFQNAVNSSVGGFRNITPEMYYHYHKVLGLARNLNHFSDGNTFVQSRNGLPVGLIALSASEQGDALLVPGLVSYRPIGGSGASMLEFGASKSEDLGFNGKLRLTSKADSINFYKHLRFTQSGNVMSLDPQQAKGWNLHNGHWSRGRPETVNLPQSPPPSLWGPTLVMTGPGIPMTVYKQGRDHKLPGMYSQLVLGPTYLPQSGEKVDLLEIMQQSYMMTTGKVLPMGDTPRSNT
jgi:hypothetical protein